MDIRFHAGGQEKWSADIALIPIWEKEKILETCPALLDAAPFLQVAPAMRDVSGRKGEVSVLHGHPDLPYSRVLFVGMGKECVDAPDFMDTLRRAYALGVRKARAMRLASAHIPYATLSRFGNPERVLEEAVYASVLANHTNRTYKETTKDEVTPSLEWLAVGFDGEFVPDSGRNAARRGERSAEAVLLARTLANEPANVLYPEAFAERARKVAAANGLRFEVLDEVQLAEQGFGAHCAVGRGGAHPPRLVILEHAPEGHEQDDPIVIVGKGITFDSGGISLKPAARMHCMKCDMTGAADTLACLAAVAEEELPRRVVGLMALAENMPDGNATHPGDIVVGHGGDRIEIVNTDAEGRLVLCDALHYARTRWTPRCMVDVATLTGACAVALGDELAGLFSNNDSLANLLLSAGHTAGEEYWRLPLWKNYAKKLASPLADICHTATREGGAITAALFLQHFVDDVPWAHLDIAGVDWTEKGVPLCEKGGTGFGARTLLELARGGVEGVRA